MLCSFRFFVKNLFCPSEGAVNRFVFDLTQRAVVSFHMFFDQWEKDVAPIADAAREENGDAFGCGGICKRRKCGIDLICHKGHIFFQNFNGDRVVFAVSFECKFRKFGNIPFASFVKFGEVCFRTFSEMLLQKG